MLKEIFHDSLKISKFTRICRKTIQARLAGKSFSSHTNSSNFRRPLQSLLLRYSYFEKGCWKNVHTTIPKGNMGYDQYTVPDTVAVEPTFVAFL